MRRSDVNVQCNIPAHFRLNDHSSEANRLRASHEAEGNEAAVSIGAVAGALALAALGTLLALKRRRVAADS